MAKNMVMDKRQSQEWAQQLLRSGRFYVFDTETTGVDKAAEIVQIGVLDSDGHVVLNTLIRPQRPCPPQATAVHGITNAMLASAPDFLDVYVQLSALFAGSTLVAYNMDFDWRMLLQSLALNQMPMIRSGSRHCAMKQYARFHGTYNSMRGDYRWHKLAVAAKHMQIEVLDAHSAVGDCRMTLALIYAMAEDR